MEQQFRPAKDNGRFSTSDNGVELIHNTNNCAWTSMGVQRIITWLVNTDNWGMDEVNMRDRPYQGSSGVGMPNQG